MKTVGIIVATLISLLFCVIIFFLICLFIGCSFPDLDSARQDCRILCELHEGARVTAVYHCPNQSPSPISVESVVSCDLVVNGE